MKANSPVRIAVAGAIGQVHIKRILAELRAEPHAIIQPSPKAQEQAAALGAPCFPDIDLALQSTKPEGVIIA